MWDLQRDFDAWLYTLDNELVLENGIPMVEYHVSPLLLGREVTDRDERKPRAYLSV
jgi:hypothetical protein